MKSGVLFKSTNESTIRRAMVTKKATSAWTDLFELQTVDWDEN